MSEKRRIVVTSALPYANGDIHLGHLVEYIQTDFWVRFQKMRGNECVSRPTSGSVSRRCAGTSASTCARTTRTARP